MTSNSFYDTFKTSLEAMKENSVLPLLTTDKDYQNYTNQESMAEAQYMQLDLSAKQKEHFLSYACLLVFLTILVFLIIGYLIVFLIAIKTQGIPL